LIADLDAAFATAARETGVGDFARNGALTPAQKREDELLRRIAQLEAQLE